MSKKWTVIIRTQGRENELELANALNSLIAQDYKNLSVILTIHTNNPSLINKTLNFIIPFKRSLDILPIVVKKRLGNRSYPLNVALKRLDSDYVSFLDNDDIYYPQMGTLLIGIIEKKNVSFAYGTSIKVVQELTKDNFGNEYLYTKSKVKFDTKDFNLISLLLDNYIPFNSFILKSSLLKGEYFDETLDYLEDWDMLRRITFKKDFSLMQIKVPVSEYRIRGDKTDTYNKENQKKWEKSRRIIDEKTSNKQIKMTMMDINTFRTEYLKEINNLHHTINMLEMNPAYKLWQSIRDNRIINEILTKRIRHIRHIIKKQSQQS